VKKRRIDKFDELGKRILKMKRIIMKKV